jgi:hypothetical protein
MHCRGKAADGKQIASEFVDSDSPSAAEVLPGGRAAAHLPCNHVNGIGYKEFTYLVDLFFGPSTPQRLLLYASVDEDHAVSPRAPGSRYDKPP